MGGLPQIDWKQHRLHQVCSASSASRSMVVKYSIAHSAMVGTACAAVRFVRSRRGRLPGLFGGLIDGDAPPGKFRSGHEAVNTSAQSGIQSDADLYTKRRGSVGQLSSCASACSLSLNARPSRYPRRQALVFSWSALKKALPLGPLHSRGANSPHRFCGKAESQSAPGENRSIASAVALLRR